MSTPVRVTVNLGPDVAAALREMADRSGISMSEALGRSIGTELFFARERAAGHRVLLRKPNGRFLEVLPYD